MSKLDNYKRAQNEHQIKRGKPPVWDLDNKEVPESQPQTLAEALVEMAEDLGIADEVESILDGDDND